MNNLRSLRYALTGTMLLWGAAAAQAQHRHHHNGYNQWGNYQHRSYYNPGYHIDHHNHPVYDNHGHVIGNYEHDVIHQNSTPTYHNNWSHGNGYYSGYDHAVQSHGGYNNGGYYVQNGSYYYTPQTASNPHGHVTSYQPQQITFGGFSHVDDLAMRLETLSNQFCLDLHYNYSHNPGFTETYREAYQVLETARYIHSAEHHNDRQAIRDRLDGLDKLFHHVQDDLRGWSRHHHRQVGSLGITTKSEQLEQTLHHLMNDVGVTQWDAD